MRTLMTVDDSASLWRVVSPMLRGDGQETHFPYEFVPIVPSTPASHPAKKQEGRAAGATGWIVKPFNTCRSLAVVKRAMRWRRAEKVP